MGTPASPKDLKKLAAIKKWKIGENDHSRNYKICEYEENDVVIMVTLPNDVDGNHVYW